MSDEKEMKNDLKENESSENKGIIQRIENLQIKINELSNTPTVDNLKLNDLYDKLEIIKSNCQNDPAYSEIHLIKLTTTLDTLEHNISLINPVDSQKSSDANSDNKPEAEGIDISKLSFDIDVPEAPKIVIEEIKPFESDKKPKKGKRSINDIAEEIEKKNLLNQDLTARTKFMGIMKKISKILTITFLAIVLIFLLFYALGLFAPAKLKADVQNLNVYLINSCQMSQLKCSDNTYFTNGTYIFTLENVYSYPIQIRSISAGNCTTNYGDFVLNRFSQVAITTDCKFGRKLELSYVDTQTGIQYSDSIILINWIKI